MTLMSRSEPIVVRTDLLALPVPPGDPAASVATVLNLVHLGELVPDPASVSALRAHEGDEMQGAQVDLQEFLQVVWLHCDLRAPGAIALLKVQPGGDRRSHSGPKRWSSKDAPVGITGGCPNEDSGWISASPGCHGNTPMTACIVKASQTDHLRRDADSGGGSGDEKLRQERWGHA